MTRFYAWTLPVPSPGQISRNVPNGICRICADHIELCNVAVCKPMFIYNYVYIKWAVFVNVSTKSAQRAHARMIAIIVEKVQTQVICTTMVSWM